MHLCCVLYSFGTSLAPISRIGTTIKAHVVNLSTEEVEGPFTLRGSLSMTVRELKELLGRSLNLNPELMRVVLERYYNDLRPLSSDTKTLKTEGFYRSNKVVQNALHVHNTVSP